MKSLSHLTDNASSSTKTKSKVIINNTFNVKNYWFKKTYLIYKPFRLIIREINIKDEFF